MNKVTLFTFVGLAVIVIAYRLVVPPSKAKSPYAHMAGVSPIETVRTAKSVPSPAAARSAPIAVNAELIRQQQQERFTDLKEEGRRIRQTILASDPRATQAFQALGQRPDYREVVDQRHKIEADWATAPDSERDAMLAQINALRQQGLAILLAEIQRVNSQPAAPPSNTPPQTTINLGGGAAPASAPGAAPVPAPAPTVFQ